MTTASHTRRRHTLRTALLLLAACCLPGTALADDRCRDDATQCGVESDQITLAFPMETKALAIHWPLRQDNNGASLALYRKLVERSGFDMPAGEPALMMYIVHLASPYEAAPGHVTRYDEGNLMMRVGFNQDGYPAEDGWYNMYMPVNDTGAYSSGLEYGYPKYLAEVSVTPTPAQGTPDTVVARASLQDGRTTTELSWTRDATAPYSDALDNVARFGDLHYSQSASHRGPTRWRSRLSTRDAMVPPGQQVENIVEPGWARVHMDDHPMSWDVDTPTQIGELLRGGETLSTLVDFDAVVPAAYLHQQTNLIFTIDNLGPRPGWTPPPGTAGDADGDTVPDDFDNCPDTWNRYQEDLDHDFVGDACEAGDDNNLTGGLTANCPRLNNELPPYPQQDGLCGLPTRTVDAIVFGGYDGFCANFTGAPGHAELCVDKDADGVYNRADNCPGHANTEQTDADGDGIGDACDWRDDHDTDIDGTVNADDNCPTVLNYSQADADGDGVGDACDDPAVPGGDDDNDGVSNSADQCPDTGPGVAVDARGCPAASGELSVTLSADPTMADVTDGAQTVTFTASPTVGDAELSGQLTYVYYFGDGSNSGETTDSSIDHVYGAAGDYTATVVVHDENGNAASDSVQITMTTTVTVEPEHRDVIAALAISTNGTTAPVTATLDASGSQHKPDGAIYTFDFGDGSSRQTTNPTVVHAYSLPGTYSVSVTVTDPADAANTSTATGQVQVNAAQQTTAILSVSPSQATVNQTTVLFDASGSVAAPGRRIVSYSYDYYGDGSVVETKAESTSSFVYTRAGNFQPIVTVSDSAQGSSQAKARVAVAPVAGNPPTDTPDVPDAPAAPAQAGGGSGSLGWLMLIGLGVAGLRRRRG